MLNPGGTVASFVPLLRWLSSPWPRVAIDKLNSTLNAIFKDPVFRKKWEAIGTPVVGGTPEQFGALIRTESVRLGRVVRESGATAD